MESALPLSGITVPMPQAKPPKDNPPESCGICRFRRDGECHRGPPQVVIFHDPEWAGAEVGQTTWPIVPPEKWCGEFEGIGFTREERLRGRIAELKEEIEDLQDLLRSGT